MLSIEKSLKLSNQVPDHGKPWRVDASSSALVSVGPGVVLAPPFVPSHGWPSIVWASVVTGPSKIVDVAPGQLTIMLAGQPEKLDGFEELARPYGITELQRTGRVALPKLNRQATPRLRLSGKAS